MKCVLSLVLSLSAQYMVNVGTWSMFMGRRGAPKSRGCEGTRGADGRTERSGQRTKRSLNGPSRCCGSRVRSWKGVAEMDDRWWWSSELRR